MFDCGGMAWFGGGGYVAKKGGGLLKLIVDFWDAVGPLVCSVVSQERIQSTELMEMRLDHTIIGCMNLLEIESCLSTSLD